jgi:hypothetical protein
MDLRATDGVFTRSRHRVVGSWSCAEWARLAHGQRPAGVIPFGNGWILLAERPFARPANPPDRDLERPLPWPTGQAAMTEARAIS